MEEIIFASGSVPVAVAARVYGKDASWIRAGIVSGWLPIGKATRSGKLVTNLEEMNSKYGRINFTLTRGVTCLFCGLYYPCPHMPRLEEQVAMAHKLRKEIEKNG